MASVSVVLLLFVQTTQIHQFPVINVLEIFVAMLLNQQTGHQESIVISHLKSTAYRNKSLSNYILTLNARKYVRYACTFYSILVQKTPSYGR